VPVWKTKLVEQKKRKKKARDDVGLVVLFGLDIKFDNDIHYKLTGSRC